MNIGLVAEGHGDGPLISVGVQGDRTFLINSDSQENGGREGWAIGLGGQVDYLCLGHVADPVGPRANVGDRVRPLAEVNFGYLEKRKAGRGFKDGASIKVFVQQDLTRPDIYVGGRLTLVDKESRSLFRAVSFQVAKSYRYDAVNAGIGVGF